MSIQISIQRITNLSLATVYLAILVIVSLLLPLTNASAELAQLPEPTAPTSSPSYFCDWMGEVQYRNTVAIDQVSSDAAQHIESTERIDVVSAEVPGQSCGMLWTGERSYVNTSDHPVNCNMDYIDSQQASGSGTGTMNALISYVAGRPIYLTISPRALTGGNIIYNLDYTGSCGNDSTSTLAWTPSFTVSDCFLEEYDTLEGFVINQNSQATVGKCTRTRNFTEPTFSGSAVSEMTWRFRKNNCNQSIDSDNGGTSDCQEYEDNTNPMSADDDVNPDSTNPTITLNYPLNGETVILNSSTIANYTCQDEVGGSGIASCVGTVADGSTLDTSSIGEKSINITATDSAGNSATVTATYYVSETTPPTITLNAPLNSGSLILGSSVNASYSCQDEVGGSGIASCVGTVANGSALDTSTVGTKTFDITATDSAGNITTVTASYSVAYQSSGFLGSIDTNAVNKAKAGQTIPVQFQLLDGNGNPISDPASFVSLTSVGTTCNLLETTDAIEQYTGNSGLQYQGNGYWQFNWKTSKTYLGQCRIIYLTLSDGTKASAKFQF